MKLVYTHQNGILVGSVKALLEQASIKVEMKNEYASGAVGELSAIDSWPEIWVSNLDEERAKIIVARLQDNTPREEWVCAACSESNDAAFEVCWQCQAFPPISP
ncbi:DUF2007 domain-containing protein [Saccharophagus degradans]|uniref:putative signal transducing protein n=1 Tax=Saccharophagus degradans TaxID=86304 RepID=UPI002477FF68|nr:DUF2007 domain-containing protein [Saccharophagus degradans]WGO99052.1 DUF2007 domain-containing protein [Saccharophagus degradans]